MHFIPAQSDQVDPQVETISAARGAWALHRSPITR
jgi:hypothetical protein